MIFRSLAKVLHHYMIDLISGSMLYSTVHKNRWTSHIWRKISSLGDVVSITKIKTNKCSVLLLSLSPIITEKYFCKSPLTETVVYS